MTLDPYQPCPCGNGKKIKFCDCSRDMVHELEKIIRAIQGEQRVAALEHIEKAIEDKGPRHALLAMKADIQLTLDDVDNAEKTITEFQKLAPYNPVALALSAIVSIYREDVPAAVEQLQRSLEYIDKTMPPTVYAAIGVVAHGLLNAGEVLAARGHLIMQASFGRDRDDEPMKLLTNIDMAREVPALLKQQTGFVECPESAAWAGEFNAAMTSARCGAWLAACESLASLGEKVPGQAAILKNIAILRGWLAHNDETVQAWRAYATLEDVPLDEAVEAEALAQLLGGDSGQETVDEVTITYPVTDAEPLMELLLSNKRFSRMPVDPKELATEDEPPPKGVFWFLDRPLVESAADLQRDDIPCVLGEIYVYGKQTDRDARLEYTISRTDEFDAKKAALHELAPQWLGTSTQEETTDTLTMLSEAMTWRWRLPDDLPRRRRQELIEEQRRETLLNRWPEFPLAVLDGKRPSEVASDEAYRVRLLAAVLLLELGSDATSRSFDFNELRTKLGLPAQQLQAPSQQDVRHVSIVELARLDPSQLDDEQLRQAFQMATVKQQNRAVHRFAEEVIARPSLEQKIDTEQVYEILINSCSDSDEALRFVNEAREAAVANGKSPARWLLIELSIRLPLMESDECNRLLTTLRSQHLNEPGIADGLYRLLVSYGVIAPDGTPAGPRPAAAASVPGDQPAAEQAKIWTPDSGPAAVEEPQKSKLWVPGMD